ncbi:MAG: hypothetical protein ACRDIE_00330 [Chloroflexota bacterium]
MRYIIRMVQVHKPYSVRLTTLVPPEVADTYRRAAELRGKSVSWIVREALEDHMAATRAEAEIASQLEGNNPSSATLTYFRLARAMHGEAMRAMIEAAMLDVDIAVAALDRVAAQYEAREMGG